MNHLVHFFLGCAIVSVISCSASGPESVEDQIRAQVEESLMKELHDPTSYEFVEISSYLGSLTRKDLLKWVDDGTLDSLAYEGYRDINEDYMKCLAEYRLERFNSIKIRNRELSAFALRDPGDTLMVTNKFRYRAKNSFNALRLGEMNVYTQLKPEVRVLLRFDKSEEAVGQLGSAIWLLDSLRVISDRHPLRITNDCYP